VPPTGVCRARPQFAEQAFLGGLKEVKVIILEHLFVQAVGLHTCKRFAGEIGIQEIPA
jgi:hypothetical protein